MGSIFTEARQIGYFALLSLLALALGACASAGYRLDAPLGTMDRPVLADSPRGEREYLHRLRCSDGNRPDFVRGGSTAPSRDGHILDGYLIRCGSSEVEAFFDMYHPQATVSELLRGFSLVEEDPCGTELFLRGQPSFEHSTAADREELMLRCQRPSNPRLQRTRMRAPLSRKPLDGRRGELCFSH
jgi:hypothetical protein